MRARSFLAAVLTALGLSLAFGATAAGPTPAQAFGLINPPLPTGGNGIEVTEFFWYGCPHCADLDPILADWVGKLPADVHFKRVPAVFPNKWVAGARLYYSLEAMNLLDRLHGEVFKAIHHERLSLNKENVLFEWVAKQGVDANQFRAAWASFGVVSRVKQAQRITSEAGLRSVPALMVQGRYLTLTIPNFDALLATTDQLIARARAEAGKK